MNSALNCKALMKTFPDLKRNIENVKINDYIIDEKHLHPLKIRLNTIRQPLSDIVMKYYRTRDSRIKCVMFQDPKIKSIGMNEKIPSILMNFMRLSPIDKRLENILDFSIRSGYRRNGDSSVDKLNLELNDFYAFYQLAVVRDLLTEKKDQVLRSYNFLDSLSICYALLVSNIIDKKYSIGGGFRMEDRSILTFLCQMFFYESMVGIKKDKAVELCLKNKYYRDYKPLVQSNTKYITSSHHNMSKYGESNPYIIDNFIEVVVEQFDSCSALDYRQLLFEFTRVYNSNCSLCLESFWAFLNMIQLVDLKINVVNVMTKDYIKESIKNTMVALKTIIS